MIKWLTGHFFIQRWLFLIILLPMTIHFFFGVWTLVDLIRLFKGF